jgi:hypothetical protein
VYGIKFGDYKNNNLLAMCLDFFTKSYFKKGLYLAKRNFIW